MSEDDKAERTNRLKTMPVTVMFVDIVDSIDLFVPEGSVAECVSLEKGGEAGAAELEAWLHKTQFRPELATPFRWISVGVGFTNQLTDGPSAR